MQCAAIEYARNVCGVKGADSAEFKNNLDPDEQICIEMLEHCGKDHGMGATMRLGRRTTVFLTDDSVLKKLYNDQNSVDERHRHRYEVNPAIVPMLSNAGLLFVGMGADETKGSDNVQTRTDSSAALVRMAETDRAENLEQLLRKIKNLCIRAGPNGVDTSRVRMEMLELQGHPYFVGVQYHPEYLSHPLKQSPPFFGLILAASQQLDSYLSGSKIPSPVERFSEDE